MFNSIKLKELQKLIELAIKQHGEDKEVRIFDYKGNLLINPKIIVYNSFDKGTWLEFNI